MQSLIDNRLADGRIDVADTVVLQVRKINVTTRCCHFSSNVSCRAPSVTNSCSAMRSILSAVLTKSIETH